MTLRAYDREDGNLVIHNDESPDAWMVVDPDIIMTDTELAVREGWTPGRPDSHPSPTTDVSDWEVKD